MYYTFFKEFLCSPRTNPMGTNKSMKSHEWDRSIDPEITPLFLALQWAQERSLEAMHPFHDKYGVSAAEFDVLATLRNAPPPHQLTPSQIQGDVVITSGGLTKIMLQLESRGLVDRPRHDGDLRVKPARLTAEGKQIIEKALKEAVGATGQWVRGVLDAQEIAQLTALLRKIVDAPQR